MTDTWKSGAEHAEAYFDENMKLRAEIERLRAELAKAHADALIANMRYVDPEGDRAKVIEECAQVVEGFDWRNYKPSPVDARDIAAAIRALRGKG